MTDREIVVELATKVMGWAVRETRLGIVADTEDEGTLCLYGQSICRDWDPLTSIDDAWMVLSKLAEKYCTQVDSVGFDDARWRCMIGWGDDPVSAIAQDDSAPRAICLAAVEAVKGTAVSNET